jgi:MYXO-CTERM domain-containing protein
VKRLIVVASMAAGLLRAGTLTPVGPFSGSLSENFDEFAAYKDGGPNGVASLGVMGGAATFTSDNGSAFWVYDTSDSSWGLDSFGTATVHSSPHGIGIWRYSYLMDGTLTFVNPVSEFGGYMAGDPGDGSDTEMLFFDVNGVQIGGASDIQHGDSSMLWYGFSSDTPIGSVEWVGGAAPVLDDLQANAADSTPEPSTMALGAFGLLAAGFLRRRRG